MATKKENIQKWIEALRSGKYRQTQGHLGDKDGFCCLGVACELAIANGVRTKRTVATYGGEFLYSGERDTMPLRVQQWLGLDGGNPDLGDDSCAKQNDTGKSFADIADMIEAEYLTERAR